MSTKQIESASPFLMIIITGVAGAITYGILHDQVTARVCLEYFTVTHPPLADSDSPTVVAIAWGIVATWWMGLLLGVPLALACRVGREPRIGWRECARWIVWLLVIMGVGALGSGIAGYVLAERGDITIPRHIADLIPEEKHTRWMADAFAHSASYLLGFVGGLYLIAHAIVVRLRRRARSRADAG